MSVAAVTCSIARRDTRMPRAIIEELKRLPVVGCVAAVGLAAVITAPARPALRACRAHDLHAEGMLQGATGTMDGAVQLQNLSTVRCALGSRPRVVITTRVGTVLRTRERVLSSGRPVSDVAGGATVELRLDWSNWCGGWSGRTGAFRTLLLRLRLTTGTTLWARVRTGRPRCDQPSAGSTLFVSRFVAPT